VVATPTTAPAAGQAGNQTAGAGVPVLVVKASLGKLAVGATERISVHWLPAASVNTTIVAADGHVSRLATHTDAAGNATVSFKVALYDPALAARAARAAHRPANQLVVKVNVAVQHGNVHAQAAGSFALTPLQLTVKARLATLALGQAETLDIGYFARAAIRATVVGTDGHVYHLTTRTNTAGKATMRFAVMDFDGLAAARLAARAGRHGPLAQPVRVTVAAALGASTASTVVTIGWTNPTLGVSGGLGRAALR
jgi:hypothetical protein